LPALASLLKQCQNGSAPGQPILPFSFSAGAIPERVAWFWQSCSIRPLGIGRMSPGVQIILSGTLTFGVPLALAIRDLWTLRRPSGGGGWRPEPPAPPAPKPTNNTDPVRKPLPACLIEAARGNLNHARPRIPEHA
jgi:hypothetical protein